MWTKTENRKNSEAAGPGNRVRVLVALALLLFAVRPAGAHTGPPFPLFVDLQIGSCVVSVWADPDIGTGTFYIVFEPPEDGDLPGPITVDIGVTPVSGRLPEARYQATPQSVRYGARYIAEVAFDQGEWWDVHIVLDTGESRRELTTKVEATPDGSIGPISMVIYLIPFLLVGFLWLKAVMRKRGAGSEERGAESGA